MAITRKSRHVAAQPSLDAFTAAARKLTRETTGSREKAVEALKAQGLLTAKTERLTKRYAPD